MKKHNKGAVKSSLESDTKKRPHRTDSTRQSSVKGGHKENRRSPSVASVPEPSTHVERRTSGNADRLDHAQSELDIREPLDEIAGPSSKVSATSRRHTKLVSLLLGNTGWHDRTPLSTEKLASELGVTRFALSRTISKLSGNAKAKIAGRANEDFRTSPAVRWVVEANHSATEYRNEYRLELSVNRSDLSREFGNRGLPPLEALAAQLSRWIMQYDRCDRIPRMIPIDVAMVHGSSHALEITVLTNDAMDSLSKFIRTELANWPVINAIHTTTISWRSRYNGISEPLNAHLLESLVNATPKRVRASVSRDLASINVSIDLSEHLIEFENKSLDALSVELMITSDDKTRIWFRKLIRLQIPGGIRLGEAVSLDWSTKDDEGASGRTDWITALRSARDRTTSASLVGQCLILSLQVSDFESSMTKASSTPDGKSGRTIDQ